MTRLRLLAFLAAMVIPMLGHAQTLACSTANERILLRIGEMGATDDLNSKIEKIEILIRDGASLTPAELDSIDQRTIDVLALFLSSKDDVVRMYVAAALAQFTYKAETALPALENAYNRTQDKPVPGLVEILPSASPRRAIASAISEIKAAVIRRNGGRRK